MYLLIIYFYGLKNRIYLLLLLSAIANSIQDLISILESESQIALNWFNLNDMIAYAKKFQAMIINRCGRHNDTQ